ncbi:pyrazinamidase/nicotinamidase [Acrasis kona]|uniref:nicotinamidase n=1 Tax=Acrasis kona TaxID=1008807 RepID=A0AAW2ZE73_9EUKA
MNLVVLLGVTLLLLAHLSSAKRALIIVDVQNDFLPGGSLAVSEADKVVPVFNKLRKEAHWDKIFQTQDWHVEKHVSFVNNHEGAEVFSTVKLEDGTEQRMWPAHCVQNTKGAEFHPDLIVEETDEKNQTVDSYSGFFDNNKASQTELHEKLQEENITEVYIGGVALDVCVMSTCVHAVELGYKTYVIEDASKGLSKESVDAALAKLVSLGVTVVNSSDIIMPSNKDEL